MNEELITKLRSIFDKTILSSSPKWMHNHLWESCIKSCYDNVDKYDKDKKSSLLSYLLVIVRSRFVFECHKIKKDTEYKNMIIRKYRDEVLINILKN